MNLVQYSESEASDDELAPEVIDSAKTANAPQQKPAFQKVVDRSNPHKIRVNLPSSNAAGTEDKTAVEEDGPPAKRAKIGGAGGGLFSGLNSFLPAPKRSGAATSGADAMVSAAGKRPLAQGLGSGFSLKTGAAPAFSREAPPSTASGSYEAEERFAPLRSGPVPAAGLKDESEVKLTGKATMFRPLSVANKAGAKKKLKKPVAPAIPPAQLSNTQTTSHTMGLEEAAPSKPRVSLFSMAPESSEVSSVSSGAGYEPLLIQEDHQEKPSEPILELDTSEWPTTTSNSAPQETGSSSTSNNLQDLASGLNLSASQRRQLFGRQGRNGPDLGSVNVVNFNTDTEYAHNEELRAKGEVVTHQPVKSISAGKHSLRQLINTAATQKDALEESFAQGSKNRKEAGSRYGW